MLKLDDIKHDEAVMRRELEAAGVQFRGHMKTFKCPFHDDGSPSGSISQHDGVWFFKCFGGCNFSGTVVDVRMRATGRTAAEVIADLSGREVGVKKEEYKTYTDLDAMKSAYANCEEWNEYTDPDTGAIDLITIRIPMGGGKKRFAQATRNPSGGWWLHGIDGKKWPIFNRKRVRDAARVVFVEGEKCVRALTAIGLVATTTPGGALSSGKCDLASLAGKKVYLWPDNDAPEGKWTLGKGVEHMRQIRETLEALSPLPELFWIEPTTLELPTGGDVADYLERYHGWTNEEKLGAIEEVLEDAQPLGAFADGMAQLEATIAGKMRSLAFGPWDYLTEKTKALMPGTVTMLCGDPGATKSFFILEAAQAWHEFGFKWCIYQIEEDQWFHMRRAVAQRVGDGRFTNTDWQEQNPTPCREWMRQNYEWYASFAQHMVAAPMDDIDLEGLGDWIQSRAVAGYEIIVADPITAVDNGKDPWMGERKFLLRIKRIARQHRCRVILVTHPTKGTHRGFAAAYMAGSTNFSRFTQTVLWMQRCEQDESVQVRDKTGTVWCLPVNRKMHLLKTRNSIGAGLSLAYFFEPKTLRFNELGVIVPDPD